MCRCSMLADGVIVTPLTPAVSLFQRNRSNPYRTIGHLADGVSVRLISDPMEDHWVCRERTAIVNQRAAKSEV